VRGPLARMRYPESWVRGHPGCAGLWPAIKWEASSSFLAPGESLKWGLKRGYGDSWKPASAGIPTQQRDACYADRVTRVSSSKLRPSCIMVKG